MCMLNIMITHYLSMAHRAVQLLDLPDEVLLMILRKLECTDILYSLEGINKRLDAMVINRYNTIHVNLARNLIDDDVCLMFDIMLNRFCSQILPRIRHNVESFILEEINMERVLLACEYLNFHRLHIVNFGVDIGLCHLTGMNITFK